jgi:hypothetical protein
LSCFLMILRKPSLLMCRYSRRSCKPMYRSWGGGRAGGRAGEKHLAGGILAVGDRGSCKQPSGLPRPVCKNVQRVGAGACNPLRMQAFVDMTQWRQYVGDSVDVFKPS